MKKYSSSDLYDVIDTVSEINCSNCHKTSATRMPDPEDEFFKDGWRATLNNVYCPLCAKLKLKSQ